MLQDSVTKVIITSAPKNSHLLETSFSLKESSKRFNSFTREEDDDDDLVHMGKKDEEIGVFSAEKYFNGGIVMEDSPRVSKNMPARKDHHHHQKEKEEGEGEDLKETRKNKVLSRGTPSVQSESSWNSQSALLRTALKNSSRKNTKKKIQGKTLLANLACKCSCSDKDAIDVRSTTSAGEISFRKNTSFGMVHEETSISPKKSIKTANSGLENQLMNMQLQPEHEVEKPRKSLEVFGSPVFESRNKSLSFDKRIITRPSSSSSPWNHHVASSETNSGGNYINDAASDASSDLFEIESLTGSKPKPYLARQVSDDPANSGCVTPPNCYSPSEASIEWSVVTASAAEYSVLSDCEEQRSVATMRSPTRSSTLFGSSSNSGKSKVNRDLNRRISGNLLGCKSHKAVRIAGDAFIRHQKTSPNVPKVTKNTNNFDRGHGREHGYGSQQLRQRTHSSDALQLLFV